ncbi:MAG TPA: fumarylacetoacetate hydrolase family protein [Fimbriimonas sp.]|nr:fumarylacetoacetate hydrolase family protein [Fimbriimonas sp.]
MKVIRYVDSAGQTRQGVETVQGRFEAEGIWPNVTPTTKSAEAAKLLAPIIPTQIIGIGQNYRRHAAESNSPVPERPIVFYKNVSAVQDPDGPIRLPKLLPTGKPDYEGELAVVIGRTCRDVAEEDALNYVAGYTCANDVSARDWQREWGGSQWCKAKSFDTFCPLGPVLVGTDEIPDPNALRIKTTLNDEVVQDWGTDDMIFSVKQLIAFLSADTTLPVGTVILTGTPHGVGMGRTPPLWLKPGDRVVVEIEGIGKLANYVE